MSERKLIVLGIEDNPEHVEALRQRLAAGPEWAVEVRALSHEDALSGVEAARDVDVIFVCYADKDAADLEVVRHLSSAGVTAPIIVVSSEGSENLAVAAIKAGAADYMVKDRMTPETTRCAVMAALQDLRMRQGADGVPAGGAPSGEAGAPAGLCEFGDFQAHLDGDIDECRRTSTPLCCCRVNVDHLSEINEAYGRDAGDVVLGTVARILRRQAREHDRITNCGDGSFCIASPEMTIRDALVLADRIRCRVSLQVFSFGDTVVRVTCSVGVAELADDIRDAADLVRRSAASLSTARAGGRDRVSPDPPGDAHLERP